MSRFILLLISLVAFNISVAQDRIITAGSSSSEIICALGLCDKIVATDRTSTYPASLQSLPSIGYRTGINAEGIIAQRPDLVIFEKGYVKEDVVSQLKSTNIDVLVVDQEYSFESTKERIRAIAAAVKQKDAGEELIANMTEGLEKLEARVKNSSERPKVLGVFARGPGNMMVAGSNSAYAIIELAGVEDAVPEIDGLKPLNAEALIKANPDYILFFESGLESIGGVEGALKITGIAQTTAGKKRQIIAMDGVMLTNWGPRLAEAATQLFELTHPQTSN